MTKLILAAVASFPVALLCSAPANAQKDGQEWTTEAVAATFQKRCASCHVVPDASVRTDRAWLDQINRTT